jgi:hypothetical protein
MRVETPSTASVVSRFCLLVCALLSSSQLADRGRDWLSCRLARDQRNGTTKLNDSCFPVPTSSAKVALQETRQLT